MHRVKACKIEISREVLQIWTAGRYNFPVAVRFLIQQANFASSIHKFC